MLFFFFGMGVALPGPLFSRAQDYWEYKFRDPSSDHADQRNRTELQIRFITWKYYFDIGPCLIALAATSMFGHKVGTRVKIIPSLAIICAMNLGYCIFCNINTDSWQREFLYVTLAMSTITSVKYFRPVCTHILSDAASLVGRIFSGPYITKRNRYLALLTNIATVGSFGILLLFCRTSPKRNSPLLFPHDWEYMCILGLHQVFFHFFIVSMILSVRNLVKPNQVEMGFLIMTSISEVLAMFMGFLAKLWMSIV
ncbi:unnamed protein product [Callosobruchus maculatus]|uniref:Uncharacterized protein n=1 Tax=Callosobruchus maculatus TaxID=64391 RepID=A0A653DML0_CALMS|nr:unnamed protein product [Callosobruchus maculatus]